MSKNSSLQELIDAAQLALTEGDQLTAMDRFGEAAEVALELGMPDVAKECAQKVVETVNEVSALEGVVVPPSLKPGLDSEKT